MDILFVTAIVILLLFVIVIFQYNKPELFLNDTVTTLMGNVPDVPSIKLIEKGPKKNIIQKILGNVNNLKISFKINKTQQDDYSVSVPSYEDYNFAGKGLVIAASGNKYRYLTGLFTNLYVIRKYHKSSIPIEIFYIGKSEEFNPDLKNLILSLGNIKIYNLLDRIDSNVSEEDLRGYQTKPLAALCSSFKEVIVMDADALVFVDPHYLFQAQGYDEFGMILFKDYVDCMSFISRDFIETIGIGADRYCDYTGDYEIDSSCVIFDKEKCWDTLFIICIINVKSDSYHKSKNVLGDKDTWCLSAFFTGLKPFISRPNPRVFTFNNIVVVGHLQATIFNSENGSEEIFTHYNNQKILLGDVDLDGFAYADIKNPKSGETNNYGLPLTKKIIECFEVAKEAMKILDPKIPLALKEKVKSVNGISKGLIP